MRMYQTEDGKIFIKGDEVVLAKLEGQSLAGVDVSDLRVDADNLAKLYVKAQGSADIMNTKRYAVMKQKYLETFGA